MRTSTRVEFGLYDVTARGDSAPTSSTAQPFCNLSADLKIETDRRPALQKYGTLERCQFLMDGSFSLFPDAPAGQFWGLWSQQQSGMNGRFADPPVLEVAFSQPHSSAGLTLHFYGPTGDWASEVLIQWLGSGGELLTSAVFTPNAVDYYCERKVENYRALRLTFRATNRPGRYLKMTGLDYGLAMTFAGDEVVQAHVLEEADLLSDEIRVNTLNLTLYNEAGQFSILNPKGVFSVLQHKQKFTVWEDVRADARAADKVSHNMGTFYLSEWRNESDTLAEFTATDAVGLLDSAPYQGGVYDTTTGELAADILAGYEYDLASALAELPVRGWLPAGTRRTALQQLAFAVGVVVDCSRSDKIKLYPAPERPSALITYRRKFQGSSVKLRPLITGVTVTAHNYVPGPTGEQLFGDDLPAGEHEIAFSEPVLVEECTGGELLAWGNNWARVRVTAAGQVALTGRKYGDATTLYRLTAADVPPNAEPNVLTIENSTLVGPELAGGVAQRVLDYYTRRYEQTFEMLAGDEVLADMLIVESFGGEKVRGALERMEFDLTGGFRAAVTVVGRRLDATASAYTGEIYAGERSVI